MACSVYLCSMIMNLSTKTSKSEGKKSHSPCIFCLICYGPLRSCHEKTLDGHTGKARVSQHRCSFKAQHLDLRPG